MLLKGVLLPVFEGENYSESARPRASQHNLFALLIRADLVILRQLVKHGVNEGITFHLISPLWISQMGTENQHRRASSS